MRSGGASATICGWATRATGRRSVVPTQPFQKDGSLIELAQEIGADTLSIIRADADQGSAHKTITQDGGSQMLPRLALACVTAIAMASSLSFAQVPSPSGVKTLNPPGAIKAEVPGVSAPGPVTSSLSPACRASIRRPTHWCRIPTPEFARLSSISG